MLEFKRRTIGNLDCVFGRSKKANEEKLPAKVAVILCHGFGAPGTDLLGISPEVAKQSAQAMDEVEYIFPAAPIELDPMFESRAWWMIDVDKIQQLMAKGEFRELGSSTPAELPTCRQAIIEIIEDAKIRHEIDDSKVVLGGFSQGSMLALDVGLNHSKPLGGLILWSSALINQAEWTERAGTQESLHIFQSHGTIDPILPFAGAELLREMLKENGHDVEFLRFAGPHTIPEEGYDAVHVAIERCLK